MNNQKGVALVTILLVVAIATVMSVSMIRDQQASIQTTRSYLSRGQAIQYALGGEELARQILFEDFTEGNGIDHDAEAWASPELHYDFDDGEIDLKITDLQGFFNLNALAGDNPRLPLARQRFVNLIAAAGADPAITDRVQDWLDRDTGARPAGAEDYEYLVYEPPYRTGNELMSDPSEFLLLGMEYEIYTSLIPFLTALPQSDLAININTAPPYVLQSLSPNLSIDAASSIVQARIEDEGFETVEMFLQSPALAGMGIANEGLSVQSVFFEIRTIARYQERFSYLTSIVHRNLVNGEMRVIYRDFSKNIRPETSGTDEVNRG